jgi:hypothetical protein
MESTITLPSHHTTTPFVVPCEELEYLHQFMSLAMTRSLLEATSDNLKKIFGDWFHIGQFF